MRLALCLVPFFLSGCGLLGNSTPPSFQSQNLPTLEDVIRKHCPSITEDARSILQGTVIQAANSHAVEPELVFAVITAESRCRSNARSRSGAVGLMQLMPKTANWLGVKNPYSPRENVFAGTKYLAYLLERFDSDVPLALAAYNAGPTRVRRHGGIPPFRETRSYVRKVLLYYAEYQETTPFERTLLAQNSASRNQRTLN